MDNGLRWYEENKGRYENTWYTWRLPPEGPTGRERDFRLFAKGWFAARDYLGLPLLQWMNEIEENSAILHAFDARAR